MNAASISIPDTSIITDNSQDSDSDASSDGIPDYYQPISSYAAGAESEADDDDDDNDNEPIPNGYHPANSSLSNGHYFPAVEDGEIEAEVEERESSVAVVEEEEDELRMRQESDSAIRRAFLEDETRRNAPLPSENAARVLEAMRAVSFSGFAPVWANHVSEDRWLHHLHHIRHPPTSSSPSSSSTV